MFGPATSYPRDEKEGYSDHQLYGPLLRQQLRELMSGLIGFKT
jgi:hypothetical protein